MRNNNINKSCGCDILYNNIGNKKFSFSTKCVDTIIVYNEDCSVAILLGEQYDKKVVDETLPS